MKKGHLALLSLLCLFSVCTLSGLLIFAFNQQQNKASTQTAANAEASLPTPMPEDTAASPEVTMAPSPEPTVAPTPTAVPQPSVVLGFAGDVNLDEASDPVKKYTQEAKGILGLFSQILVDEMNQADLMMVNNEFTYSTRGTKANNKSFTFRANPERVNILKEMGVDLVSLANNHSMDYGQEAFIDTLSTLDNAGIAYVGAGEDMSRAKAPVYKTVGDKTIAFVAASRVVFDVSWYATNTSPGMLGTYAPEQVLKSIEEAKANSDFVVMYVHWGVELSIYPEDYERALAQKYIDAGADVVIGCHPHVMQGFEYYNGKLIAYSLGNYLFNDSTRESGMLKLYLDPDGTTRAQILPVMNKDMQTYLLHGEEDKANYFKYLEGLSFETVIDDQGFITEDGK